MTAITGGAISPTTARTMASPYFSNWMSAGGRRAGGPSLPTADWGIYSLSGAVWDGETLLATGHDKKVIYRLKVPKEGKVVELVEWTFQPVEEANLRFDCVRR